MNPAVELINLKGEKFNSFLQISFHQNDQYNRLF